MWYIVEINQKPLGEIKMKVIFDARTNKPIKTWCMNPEEGAIEQAANLSKLPFLFKHVALMPDTHQGYGMPIGGVIATDGVVVPNAVGVDIGCGMQFVKSSINAKHLSKHALENITSKIKREIPVGFSRHKKPQDISHMPTEIPIISEHFISYRERDAACYSIGTLGGGNHFIEIQKAGDGKVCIMVHSGSRNLGKQIADHYNKEAIKLNEKWFSSVPKEWQLAFLPLDSDQGYYYMKEMNFALEFAKCNRTLMMNRIMQIFYNELDSVAFGETVDVHHNFARMENHYGKNVMIHRKGATSAKEDEIGIIPGSQGTASYIVRGKGNKESFTSCSHGAGRKMGRKQAQKSLNLAKEKDMLDKQGIIHSIKTTKDLDEAPSSYKDISVVMDEQADLVDIVHELKPMGVVKG